MNKGSVHVICGNGNGKTSAALGKGLIEVNQGRSVIVIQFLKGSKESYPMEAIERLEPDMKVFRFEKSHAFFETLSKEEKDEELINIRNGLNFAKKVLTTGECDVLILDEFLGLLDQELISDEDIKTILASRDEEVDIILTGQVFPERLSGYIDSAVRLENIDLGR